MVDLAFAIESATWKLQGILEAKGYPRIKLEYFRRSNKNILKLVTETDSGIRMEFYFPLPIDMNLIYIFAEQLPFPPAMALGLPMEIVDGWAN